MSNADQVLSVTVAKTSKLKAASDKHASDHSEDRKDVSENLDDNQKSGLTPPHRDPLAEVFKVPVDELRWLVGDQKEQPRSQLTANGAITRASEDWRVVCSAAQQALTCTTSKQQSINENERNGAASGIANETAHETTQVASALGRELSRMSEAAAKLVKQCEAAMTCEPAFYARAASKVASLVAASATGAQTVLRADFTRSGRSTVNVPALVCPEIALAWHGLFPLASKLARLPLSTKYREAARCLREVERREKRASELAALTRGLRDASVRELSETDLDAAVEGAFENLHAGIGACRQAAGVCVEANSFCLEAARLSTKNGALDFFCDEPDKLPEAESQAADSEAGDGLRHSEAFDLVRDAKSAAHQLRNGISRRIVAAAASVEELEQLCVRDIDEAQAAVAAAESKWAADDVATRSALLNELKIRETELAAKAKAMATLLSNHAREVVDLADSARDRLIAHLQSADEVVVNDKSAHLSRYFDLADESMRARADMIRRQIRERERIIAAFDDARGELSVTRCDVERTHISAEAFRCRTRARLKDCLEILATARIAAQRASMIKRAIFADATNVLSESSDNLTDAATSVARLDVDLRLAHARLASLALRVEIERQNRATPLKNMIVKALLDGVNSTKLELHRIREDYAAHALAVEASLADLAELEHAAVTAAGNRRDDDTAAATMAPEKADDVLLRIFASPYDSSFDIRQSEKL